MKNDNTVTSKKEKRSVDDFEHKMTFRLQQKDYIEYSLFEAMPEWEKNKNKAKLYTVIFTITGMIALVRGLLMEQGWLSDIYIAAGIVFLVFQGVNLFYTYKMFPKALEKAVTKEISGDDRLAKEMTLCFDPDKIVSFSGHAHQASFFKEDMMKRKNTENNIIILMRNGKSLVIPKREFEKADKTIQEVIQTVKQE